MHGANKKLSSQAWLRVYRVTGLLTCVAIILSIIITNVIMEVFSAGINVQGLVVSIVTPILLGGPSVLFIMIGQERLRAANAQLQKLASYDFLTDCLNRGAFAAKVGAWLHERGAAVNGALLMIDADNFKSINDLYGHDVGDEALVIIARSIRSVLREGDLVGRMGGEEFGVFLPNASEDVTTIMAERIRTSVNRARFAPGNEPHALSVSIGGAVFAGHTNFAELFRLADRHLYGAKNAGRNMSTIEHLQDNPAIMLKRSA